MNYGRNLPVYYCQLPTTKLLPNEGLCVTFICIHNVRYKHFLVLVLLVFYSSFNWFNWTWTTLFVLLVFSLNSSVKNSIKDLLLYICCTIWCIKDVHSAGKYLSTRGILLCVKSLYKQSSLKSCRQIRLAPSYNECNNNFVIIITCRFQSYYCAVRQRLFIYQLYIIELYKYKLF